MSKKITMQTKIEFEIQPNFINTPYIETTTLEELGFNGDIENRTEVESYLDELMNVFLNENVFYNWRVGDE